MERPSDIAVVFLLDEAHRLVSRLYWTQKLEEIILRWLYATPSDMDNLSDSAKQRLEESDLFRGISAR